MSNESSFSSSGFIEIPQGLSENQFTECTALTCNGFNQLIRAKRFGKWFMLKGLKPEYQTQTIYVEMLAKEFELGVQLTHPNIVQVIGKEMVPKFGPCIIMEYIDGETLDKFLQSHPSVDTRKKIVRELLDAMSYFHSKQIIHRDLKPGNILITHNGSNLKIIDFGLSDTDYHTILKQPAGTAKYIAPEQKQNGVTLDCRADIYAFGLILQRIFPNKYRHIVRKCTQLDREKRYNNTTEIIAAFNRKPLVLPIIAVSILVILTILILFKNNFNANQTPELIVPAQDTDIVDLQQIDSTTTTPQEIIREKPTTEKENITATKTSTIQVEEKPTVMPPATSDETIDSLRRSQMYGEPDENALMDSIEKNYETIYENEIKLCYNTDSYTKDLLETISDKCEIQFNTITYEVESERLIFKLKRFAEDCHDKFLEKYRSRINSCEALIAKRDYIETEKQRTKNERSSAIKDAVDIYINNEFGAYPNDWRVQKLTPERFQEIQKEYPWEARQAKLLFNHMLPIYRQTLKKLEACKSLSAQLDVLKNHFKEVYICQSQLEANLTSRGDTVIFQYGFYSAFPKLHKRVIAPHDEFVIKFSVESHYILLLYVDEDYYARSPLFRPTTDEERNKYITKRPRGFQYGPNEIPYILHKIYTIPTKQYVILFT
ncbi:MAG: serine/threonine-protein kinase [Paludibacteraceae bacterium]|nr:serine/threonine-protein kinase [Paludibacteraceae bacterium]